MKQHKHIICVAVVALLFAAMTLSAWFLPTRTFSDSERRKLAQFPSLSFGTLLDGSFMSDFETYTQDQFPLRDSLRTLKSLAVYYAFAQSDNNGIVLEDGYAAKLEYPLNEDSLAYAANRFAYIYDRYLADKDMDIYLSIVPDKSYFLSDSGKYPAMDYEKLFSDMQVQMPYATYLDIVGTLDISDYYKTDTHWRQEKLTDTASVLANGMGVTLSGQYTVETLNHPFYGVYYGQSALPLPAETIYYLTNDTLNACLATNHEANTTGGLYDMEKAVGKDPYEMFLSGSLPLVTIENPNAKTDRELIIFRDSFGSSIAPLLAEGYSTVTLIDIRYLRADFLDRFVTFDQQDVLFLYSTLVLNNSETLT